ncbi:hypothetical protein BT96DRAFT_930584 [Gymnopus androsaceus JB14]|uniref:Uncharacterized protein n=1 Tax=Gymnopus androsaceus JB14 TaxID=1447944 RepID=A0A6A4ILZ8_9AGAR|nr:hypothetical protein BT96DRAFT_930584 [Gymnopus androsaceus JB14]
MSASVTAQKCLGHMKLMTTPHITSCIYSLSFAPLLSDIPSKSVSTEFDDGISCATIQSVYPPILDSPPVMAKTPVLIFLCLLQPSNTLGNREEASLRLSRLSELFRNAWSSNSGSKIICTDLSSLLILQLSPVESDVVIHEHLLLDQSLVAARVAIAAYIYDALPDNAYLAFPRATKAYDPPVVHGGFAGEYALITPYWPVDIDSIAPDTMDCIRVIARPHVLDEATRVRLAASTAFELKILEQLVPAREPRAATVYRCEIVSIDGETVLTGPSNFCVKLFDDRLLVMHSPEEPNEEMVGPDEGWWREWSTNEQCIRNEHAAYQQLSFAQGSIVPWYYGPSFSKPVGTVYMAFCWNLSQMLKTMDDVPAMSEEHHVQLIRNARHALRAMQYADVSQHDFNREQLMVLHTPVPHIVLLDFASASTSTEPELHEDHDYANMLMVLSDRKDGRVRDLTVLTHFGEREVWDRGMNSYPDGKGGWLWVSAPDPFVCHALSPSTEVFMKLFRSMMMLVQPGLQYSTQTQYLCQTMASSE